MCPTTSCLTVCSGCIPERKTMQSFLHHRRCNRSRRHQTHTHLLPKSLIHHTNTNTNTHTLSYTHTHTCLSVSMFLYRSRRVRHEALKAGVSADTVTDNVTLLLSLLSSLPIPLSPSLSRVLCRKHNRIDGYMSVLLLCRVRLWREKRGGATVPYQHRLTGHTTCSRARGHVR